MLMELKDVNKLFFLSKSVSIIEILMLFCLHFLFWIVFGVIVDKNLDEKFLQKNLLENWTTNAQM